MAGLIDAIINPAQADVIGSLEKGRKRQAKDLAGEILGQTQTGQLGALFRLDPDMGMALAKSQGIPTDSEGRQNKWKGTVVLANQMAQSGDQQSAIAVIDDYIASVQGATQGEELAQNAQRFVDRMRQGDTTAFDELNKLSTGLTATQGEAFTLGKDQTRFDKDGNVIGRGGAGSTPPAKAPVEILKGLPTSSVRKAKEAFNLAGGGKDGVKAMNAQIALDKTTTQREDVPNLLADSFPNANAAELQQLQASVDGAKTVESGLKSADKVRSEQRRLVKAATFQDRAISLLTNILDSDELNDVVGSIEGDDSSFFGITVRSDEEANVIADIEEAQSILTSDNMSLMTGVLSESDIKLLMNLSSGALNRKRGEGRFRKDTQELLDRLSSVRAVPVGSDTEQDPASSPEIEAKRQRLAELRSKAGR